MHGIFSNNSHPLVNHPPWMIAPLMVEIFEIIASLDNHLPPGQPSSPLKNQLGVESELAGLIDHLRRLWGYWYWKLVKETKIEIPCLVDVTILWLNGKIEQYLRHVFQQAIFEEIAPAPLNYSPPSNNCPLWLRKNNSPGYYLKK